jgi:hypothetical protein
MRPYPGPVMRGRDRRLRRATLPLVALVAGVGASVLLAANDDPAVGQVIICPTPEECPEPLPPGLVNRPPVAPGISHALTNRPVIPPGFSKNLGKAPGISQAIGKRPPFPPGISKAIENRPIIPPGHVPDDPGDVIVVPDIVVDATP